MSQVNNYRVKIIKVDHVQIIMRFSYSANLNNSILEQCTQYLRNAFIVNFLLTPSVFYIILCLIDVHIDQNSPRAIYCITQMYQCSWSKTLFGLTYNVQNTFRVSYFFNSMYTSNLYCQEFQSVYSMPYATCNTYIRRLSQIFSLNNQCYNVL